MMGSRLVKIIQEAGKVNPSENVDLLFGLVTSVKPLKIKIDNRFEVGEDFLILSAFVKETIIKVPFREDVEHTHTMEPSLGEVSGVSPAGNVIFTHTGGGGGESVDLSHTHKINMAMPEIMLWRGLEKGDKVRVLRVAGGQMFYVIEREEGID